MRDYELLFVLDPSLDEEAKAKGTSATNSNVNVANGGAGGTTGNLTVGADMKNVTVTFRNTVKVGQVTISKTALKYYNNNDVQSDDPMAGDKFWFRIDFRRVFGKDGNNVAYYDEVDYKIDGVVNRMITGIDSNGDYFGIVKLEAGKSAVIEGIPEGTITQVHELHMSTRYDTIEGWEAVYNTSDSGRNPTTNHGTGVGTYTVSYPVTDHYDSAYLIEHDSTPPTVAGEYSFTNKVKNPTVTTTNISLTLQKKWSEYGSTDAHTDTVKFLLLRYEIPGGVPTVADATTIDGIPDGEAWSTFGGTNNDGIYTVSSFVAGNSTNNIGTIADVPIRNTQNGNYYVYRLIEYGKDDSSLIYKNGGYYDDGCKAIYESTSGGSTVHTNWVNAYGKTDNPILYITNQHVEQGTTVETPTGMPKTGARGVYAIVTFGAFAITIAGVALLIYRKKLQTVNIYAVKGSEKPKE